MECIQRFMDKLKIDLTVRFTKHIQLNHFSMMDSVFRKVNNFLEEDLRDAAHNEFESEKEWRLYYANQEKIAKQQEAQALND